MPTYCECPHCQEVLQRRAAAIVDIADATDRVIQAANDELVMTQPGGHQFRKDTPVVRALIGALLKELR